jgi:hypothetical protein
MLQEQEDYGGLSSTEVDVQNISCPVNVEKILKKFNI